MCNFRNDNGLYYKTTILANLALVRSVNYNRRYGHKACYKLKHTFTGSTTLSIMTLSINNK
jgi:hypothetical protein